MATNKELIALAKTHQLPNYRPAPMVLVKGEGCRVEDAEGNAFLDLSGGIAVLSVGHCHPVLAARIAEQASRLMHVSNLFYNDQAIGLASAICARTPFDRVYFANSGTEANEALIKIARYWHHQNGRSERIGIVSTQKSFHGRSYGSLSLTGQPKYHVGMGPMLEGVSHIPYNDIDALRAAVTDTTAAVILEPVQAEGGIIVPADAYLHAARELCDQVGALLLFDEVQTGYGRTGRFLAQEWSGVEPDACSLAKGIGGGFPLAAMAVKEHLAGALPPGTHASTFGGNALACAAGQAVLDIIDDEGLVARSEQTGHLLAEGLRRIANDLSVPAGTEQRGRGLLQGIVLADDVDPRATLGALREEGLLLCIAGGNVLRFAPPLNVSSEDIETGLRITADVLSRAPQKASS
jgi:predicted acetylornithine/succinylornithine family transaminase